MVKFSFTCILLLMVYALLGQGYPASGEADNSRMLVTFGRMSDECSSYEYQLQSVYFALPEKRKDPFYVRLFDPDCGGELDLIQGLWETNTLFELYGGEGVLTFPSVPDQPSGNLLNKSVFARESLVDKQWVSLGPFEASQGEVVDEYPGYVFFRLFIRGRTGDDGNLFSLFISGSEIENLPVEGGTVFQFRSVMMDSGKLALHTYQNHDQQDKQFPLPVNLNPITPNRDISISADPIDD